MSKKTEAEDLQETLRQMKNEAEAERLRKEYEKWENSKSDEPFDTWKMKRYVDSKMKETLFYSFFLIIGAYIASKYL